MRTDAPIALAANQPARAYLGGDGIAALRGSGLEDDHRPEDFVASTTEVFTGGNVGLTRLHDGRLLRDAIADEPVAFLGTGHVERWGASSELLVKLLDPAERLFVHFHPGATFAARELASGHGKTEAWIVVAVRPVAGVLDPHAYLGFTRNVGHNEIERWVVDQDVDAMLAAMHRVTLDVGDTIYVPAGTPHSIGPGITMVELQEPTDLSILLEYRGFDNLGPDDAFLGLEPEVALGALDRRGRTASQISALIGRRSFTAEPGTHRLLPDEADAYFRADWIRALPGTDTTLDRGFTVLVVVDGEGSLEYATGRIGAIRGDTFLIPFGAGPVTITGDLAVLACRPTAA